MSVPKLEYDDSNLDTEYHTFSRFVHRSLFLHKAPVLERLSFNISPRFSFVDIGTWIKLGVTRCLHRLDIVLSYYHMPIRLPESLYTCKTLGCLELSGAVLVDVLDPVCLPSLINLFLVDVMYSDEESVHRLLSGCPILECLVVRRIEGDNLMTFTVKVPSLQILGISRDSDELQNSNHGFVIDAPSLTWLAITDHNDDGFCLIDNIPMLETASIDVVYNSSEKLMGSLTSAKHLRFCISIPKPVYPKGTTFHRLKKLELCTCTEGWLDLLMSLLQDSPKLGVLKLKLDHLAESVRPVWNQPSSVRECFSFNLKTIEWNNYKGSEEEKELEKFILRNGDSLNNVIISSNPTTLKQKLRMIKEITLLSRASATCELVFN